MDSLLYYVGIDIAKNKFDVAVKLQNDKHKHKVFDNHLDGFQMLIQWLALFGSKFHCVMEATNIYHEALADFLINITSLSVSSILSVVQISLKLIIYALKPIKLMRKCWQIILMKNVIN